MLSRPPPAVLLWTERCCVRRVFDFVVNEIDPDGRVVRLTSKELPAAAQPAAAAASVSDEARAGVSLRSQLFARALFLCVCLLCFIADLVSFAQPLAPSWPRWQAPSKVSCARPRASLECAPKSSHSALVAAAIERLASSPDGGEAVSVNVAAKEQRAA